MIYPQTAEMPQAVRARFIVEDTDISIAAATVNLHVALQSKDGRDIIRRKLGGTFLNYANRLSLAIKNIKRIATLPQKRYGRLFELH